MIINIILAASQNNVIGIDNDLPWKLTEDMKYFKKKTSGATVLMGRKCWESIPSKFRPLPNRENIVLTRNTEYVAEGATVIHDMNKYIEDNKDSIDTLWIIGGSEIYTEALEFADNVYLTRIQGFVEGNIHFSGFNPNKWEQITNPDEEYRLTYFENDHTFDFEVYKRKI